MSAQKPAIRPTPSPPRRCPASRGGPAAARRLTCSPTWTGSTLASALRPRRRAVLSRLCLVRSTLEPRLVRFGARRWIARILAVVVALAARA